MKIECRGCTNTFEDEFAGQVLPLGWAWEDVSYDERNVWAVNCPRCLSESNGEDLVSITRHQGAFGPNRWRTVTLADNEDLLTFDLAVVASGAIVLEAAIDQEGRLCRPGKGDEWRIRLSSTGGGKVTEKIGGWHARKGWEPSCRRHKGFQLARGIFSRIWEKYHDDGEADLAIRGVMGALENGGLLPALRPWLDESPASIEEVRGDTLGWWDGIIADPIW